MKFDNSSKFFWFLVASLAFFSIVGTVGLIFGFVASAILTLLYKLSDSFVADAIEEGKRPRALRLVEVEDKELLYISNPCYLLLHDPLEHERRYGSTDSN